jgi:ABC-type polysaccharide/polyol phosphate transport system ATPase subunit
MSRDGTVAATRVWKRFRPDRRRTLLRDELQRLRARFRRGARLRWVWALRDVDFALEPGESVGLVGANGSGKSTLLKILTRVMYPSAGSVEATGRVGALIEVASGLHPELSGRENAFLYGSLLGLSRRDVARRFDEIIAFAELEQAVDRQLKFYSSGMKMRLGFAVAAFLEPDILLIDEVLAVGDASFQNRCLARMREVLEQGTTLIYVSHDLPTVEATCNRGLWLEAGVVRADGAIRQILGEYRRSIEAGAELELRHDGPVRVVDVRVGGAGDDIAHTTAPLEAGIVLEAIAGCRGRLLLGITEGPGTPILLFARDLLLDEGKTSVDLRVADLPLPGGRYFLWVGMFVNDKTLLPWGPTTHFDVAGPDLLRAPRGIARLAPVYADAAWQVAPREP